MLGNVLLLCFVLFSIFGIVGVQLWKGVLRNRCFLDFNRTSFINVSSKSWLNDFYQPDNLDSFICSEPGSSGMTTCSDIPIYNNKSKDCNSLIEFIILNNSISNNKTSIYSEEMDCLYSYYTKCEKSNKNPFNGAISFDNIGYAWISIFQIITLENWSSIMYYIKNFSLNSMEYAYEIYKLGKIIIDSFEWKAPADLRVYLQNVVVHETLGFNRLLLIETYTLMIENEIKSEKKLTLESK
jgi:voltage-dependent calcium channel T type alpha-1G